MNKLISFVLLLVTAMTAHAQTVTASWSLSDKSNLGESSVSSALITTSYLQGTNVSKTETMSSCTGATGFDGATFNPPFTMFYVDTKQTTRTAGRCISFGVTPQNGHTFKPTRLKFDAAKCGTDGGNIDVTVKPSGGTETVLVNTLSPLRNRVDANNPDGYGHYEFDINDQLVEGKAFIVILYFYNINGTDVETPKSIAFRNVELEGVLDEPIFTAEHYTTAFSCKDAEGNAIDLMPYVKGLGNGGTASYPTKLFNDPKDFTITALEGFTASVDYQNKVASVIIKKGEAVVYRYNIRFVVSTRPVKPEATPLKRGLMSLNLAASGGSGNLVSWRFRENDLEGVKFKLYRGTTPEAQTIKLNSGNFITNKTNFADAAGTTSSYYKLEVYDADGNLLNTEVSGKTWANQSLTVPLGTGPTDPDHGASYTPNDASYCDMDGDGEYEIILKWSPSNEKDAASSGTTSSPYFDCLKLDGTRLWRIRLGDNFFTSAHTIQFIAWDFDGDGYGEFMCKTGPGTVDGQGNYVLLGDDTPDQNLLSGRGKQDHGSEYITVFDGMTGAEISTIPYHTTYTDGQNYWGDSNQNRSERYLAALAYLDGYDKNPSPIFARGYYSGAFIGAYDFDGEQLTQRWVHRAYSATNGKLEYGDGTSKTLDKTVYGEGAHWISVGDVDNDGKQEIIYGSACLDHDGTCLYRTGLGHGDALHLGDMIPDHEGLEVLMCHEHKPYGIDIRDARTGAILQRQTESGDTGRGLAAHFDSTRDDWQFLTSARAQMYNCSDQSENAASWALGSSGAGINCRIYWDGDLYDEFFDKSIIAHWDPANKTFNRFKFNNGNYLWGNLNNSSKNNPCVLGDILGDWREEIVTWTGDATSGYSLYINATDVQSSIRVPHLMDDYQYRVQVVNQNCAYNQPPHLSYDPARRFHIPYSGVITEGTYYIRNVATQKYLQAGESWGTRAIVGEHPAMDVKLLTTATDTYTFDTQISNGGSNHYLSGDTYPYTDGAAGKFVIKRIQGNNYYIALGSQKLHACLDSAMVSFQTAPSNLRTAPEYQWQFVDRATLLTEMSNATADAPADATFLIKDPNFGRNDQRYSAWKWSEDCTHNNNSGNETNYCVESWHSTFTCSQTITKVPNGYYRLKAQGFYRIDEGEDVAPVLFANEETQAFPKLTTGEGDMKGASAAFSAGKYAIEPITIQVTDGTLTVGVRNTHPALWAIWDNFELQYLGAEDPTSVTSVNVQRADDASIYNLQGVRVARPTSSGIYISNGKKIVK